MPHKKKICITFLGNALNDSRITNLKASLGEDGHIVKVISFDWITPRFTTYKDRDITVYKLRKTHPSVFFYLNFYLKSFFALLGTKADIYFAEEVYSLPVVKFVSVLKRAKIYYNSRELYAFLGGLRNRRFVQKLMALLEKLLIKKVDMVLTTGEMDSEFLHDFYGIKNTLVIRNIPKLKQPDKKVDLRKILDIPQEKKILLYQGVLIDGRAIKLLIQNMPHLENCVLVLLGDGDLRNDFEHEALSVGVKDRVYFMGTIPQEKLINYTAAGDVGLCLIENISVSYYHALPNKLFEYINAGLPVLSSKLPQMEKIVKQFRVGKVIDIENRKNISAEINDFINDGDRMAEFKKNTSEAAKELNWDVEYSRVKEKLLEGL